MSYKSSSIATTIATILAGVALVAVFVILLAWPLMLLINWLFAPSFLMAVFGVSHLTFFKTWALMFICGVLFGGSVKSK